MKDGNGQLPLLLPERAKSAKSSKRSLGQRLREFFGIQCPTCKKAVVPFGEPRCPGCGAIPTLKSAFDATFVSGKRHLEDKVRRASKKSIRKLQWAYLLLSGAILWLLLPLVYGLWAAKALLVVYVAVLGFYVVWLSPRSWRVAFFLDTPGIVKLAISLNFFSFLVLLQVFIGAHMSSALEVATLFVIAWAASFLLHVFFLPMLGALWRSPELSRVCSDKQGQWAEAPGAGFPFPRRRS